MTPLEAQIASTVGLEFFANAARSALSGQAGADLITALLSVAHPMYPPEGRTPEDVAREIGRREVVSLLIRQTDIRPPHHDQRRPPHHDQRPPRHWSSANPAKAEAHPPQTGDGHILATDIYTDSSACDHAAGTDVDPVGPADTGH